MCGCPSRPRPSLFPPCHHAGDALGAAPLSSRRIREDPSAVCGRCGPWPDRGLRPKPLTAITPGEPRFLAPRANPPCKAAQPDVPPRPAITAKADLADAASPEPFSGNPAVSAARTWHRPLRRTAMARPIRRSPRRDCCRIPRSYERKTLSSFKAAVPVASAFRLTANLLLAARTAHGPFSALSSTTFHPARGAQDINARDGGTLPERNSPRNNISSLGCAEPVRNRDCLWKVKEKWF